MHDTKRTANLLGATALAVTDTALGGPVRVSGLSNSGAAAVVVLSASGELSVTELGRRVGLSQSAAVRMVDGLQAGGLVERRSGLGRSVLVRLSTSGTDTARDLLQARGAPLTELVSTLSPSQQETLSKLLAKLLTGIYEHIGDAEKICRMCDRASCVRNAACPVGEAERQDRAPG
ncbi:MAG: MarR family winged helix-turn-helix transcriptional regulator [Stackebrandtia sp.]